MEIKKRVITMAVVLLATTAGWAYALPKGSEEIINDAQEVLRSVNVVKLIGINVEKADLCQIHSTIKGFTGKDKIPAGMLSLEEAAHVVRGLLNTTKNINVAVVIYTSPDKIADTKEKMGRIITQLQSEGRHIMQISTNHAATYLIETVQGKGLVIIADKTNEGKGFLASILGVSSADKAQGGEGISETGGRGNAHEIPPPEDSTHEQDVLPKTGLDMVPADVPKEEYFAIPVPAPGKYVFLGSEYTAQCEDNFCVVFIPKNLVNHNTHLCIRENRITFCPNGTITLMDLGVASLSKTVRKSGNKKTTTYVGKGYYPVAIRVKIPKIDGKPPKIVANAIYIETDPVLKIFLKTYNGNVAVSQITTESTSKVIEDKISFESCTLNIAHVVTAVEDRNGNTVLVSFQVVENDMPVYVPTVDVTIAGKKITPQYDPVLKTYVARTTVPKGTVRIHISARAEGCSTISYAQTVPVGMQTWDTLVKQILLIIALSAIAITVLRIAYH